MERTKKGFLRPGIKLPFPGEKEKGEPGEGDRTVSGGSKKAGGRGGKKREKMKKWVKLVVILIAAGLCFAGYGMYSARKARKTAAAAEVKNTATVTRGSISSELSSSGTLAAKDTYSITPMVEGEVLAADFEEGDQVEKDQILYEIDKSGMESQLTSAGNTLTRSMTSREDALADYNDALNDYSGNTYKATDSGYIKELKIKAGDKVSGNTELAQLYSDELMELKIPFLSGEAGYIGAGLPAVITITDTEELLLGTVKSVANQEETLTGGRLVRYVYIDVANPGGLTPSMKAAAQVGEFIGSEEGTFQPSVDTVMKADLSTSVEVEALLVNEGDYVTRGTPLFRMTSKTADKLIQSYKDALDKAEESVETAQNKLDTTQDSYDNYTIKAPISGQVITKSYKAGDTITKNSGSTTVLATIYDLSSLTFEMSIDELDIRKVKVGQKVRVTADAFENETFSGTVTNVSLESANANGVTTYPVTVTLDEMGELLPGMNVDGVITLDQAEDVLMIPVDALMRGNQVYVKDDTVTERQGPVPAGFRSLKVETGLTSDAYVEIKRGLSEGEVVYVAESSSGNSSYMMMPAGGMGGAPGGNGGGNRRGQMGGGPR